MHISADFTLFFAFVTLVVGDVTLSCAAYTLVVAAANIRVAVVNHAVAANNLCVAAVTLAVAVFIPYRYAGVSSTTDTLVLSFLLMRNIALELVIYLQN